MLRFLTVGRRPPLHDQCRPSLASDARRDLDGRHLLPVRTGTGAADLSGVSVRPAFVCGRQYRGPALQYSVLHPVSRCALAIDTASTRGLVAGIDRSDLLAGWLVLWRRQRQCRPLGAGRALSACHAHDGGACCWNGRQAPLISDISCLASGGVVERRGSRRGARPALWFSRADQSARPKLRQASARPRIGLSRRSSAGS